MNELKLELIKMTYDATYNADEAVKEAEKLYAFVNQSDSKVKLTGDPKVVVVMPGDELEKLRRNYDEKVDMGSSA